LNSECDTVTVADDVEEGQTKEISFNFDAPPKLFVYVNIEIVDVIAAKQVNHWFHRLVSRSI